MILLPGQKTTVIHRSEWQWIINANDKVLHGGSLPRYQYGGNINLAYEAFDF